MKRPTPEGVDGRERRATITGVGASKFYAEVALDLDAALLEASKLRLQSEPLLNALQLLRGAPSRAALQA